MKIYTDQQNEMLKFYIDKMYKMYMELMDKYEKLQKENQQLRAIINAPDLDYPNSKKGGTGDSGTPTIFPDMFYRNQIERTFYYGTFYKQLRTQQQV